MAPLWPEEVDVFSVPHSRMKELVQRYLDMMSSINFSDVVNLTTLLESLCNTFKMFKAHEQIENKYIMRRLREKLQALSITNRAVCNCHKDSRLSTMLRLLQQGHNMAGTTDTERHNFGLKLRQALEDFTQQFLPHMEEEEEVFQPMLVEYFSYEELKEIKAKVIKKHLIQEQCELFSVEKCVEDALSSESSDEEVEVFSQRTGFNHLPYEVQLKVVSYLSPRDLARCAQVCHGWNALALDGSLWLALYPVSWAKGLWSFEPPPVDDDYVVDPEGNNFVYDEDADIDESTTDSYIEEDTNIKQAYKEARLLSSLVCGLLPRVGHFVRKCSLAFSRGLCSGTVHKLLRLCPNLEHLDLTHSPVSDVAFKGFGMDMCGKKLRYLNLTGCTKITDLTLERLAYALKVASSVSSTSDIEDVQRTNSKSCHHGNKSVIPENAQPSDVSWNCSPADSVIPCCSHTELSTLSLVSAQISDSDVTHVSSHSKKEVSVCCYRQMAVCCRDVRSFGVVSEQDRDVRSNGVVPGQDRDVRSNGVVLGHDRDVMSNGVVSGHDRDVMSNGVVLGQDRDVMSNGVVLGQDRDVRSHGVVSGQDKHAGLQFLSLSGCYQITDAGLRSLAELSNLTCLQYLDLSGCVDITADGLTALVSACTGLEHTYLFYCDNLAADPYPSSASSCQNLECASRYCCRAGD